MSKENSSKKCWITSASKNLSGTKFLFQVLLKPRWQKALSEKCLLLLTWRNDLSENFSPALGWHQTNQLHTPFALLGIIYLESWFQTPLSWDQMPPEVLQFTFFIFSIMHEWAPKVRKGDSIVCQGLCIKRRSFCSFDLRGHTEGSFSQRQGVLINTILITFLLTKCLAKDRKCHLKSFLLKRTKAHSLFFETSCS